MNKYIIVFCEGEHDIAFLTRILYVNGFKPYDKKVKEFIKPLNNFYIKSLKNKKIEDIEFKFQRPNQKVPYTVLIKNSNLVIFHNLSGDGNILNGNANLIVQMYLDLNRENRRKIEKYNKLDYRFLYFLDSDEEGVSNRIENLNSVLELDNLKHYEITQKDDYEVGCAVFYNHLDKKKNGKLEDILLDLMKKDNENIFDNINIFVKNNSLETNRQRRFICNNEEESYKGNIQFKEQKSIISIAGQLQFSGSSNSVIIANSDYIQINDI